MERLDVGLPLFTLGTAHQVPRTNAGATAPEWVGLSALLDAVFGSTRGMVLRRGSSAWEALAKGATNTILSADANDTVFQTLTTLIDSIGSTRGAILYRGSGGWAILAPNTSGYVLTDGGSGADPSWAAASAGKLQLVEHKLVTSAVQTVTFSSLAGDTDKTYLLVYSIKSGAASNTCEVRPNGASTNLYGQFLNSSGGTTSGGNTTNWRLHAAIGASGGEIFGHAIIGAIKTRNSVARRRTFVSNGFSESTAGSAANVSTCSGVWNETSTEITSLDVHSSVASGIGDGSTLTLYKLAES